MQKMLRNPSKDQVKRAWMEGLTTSTRLEHEVTPAK
jgi:hypothetical protein